MDGAVHGDASLNGATLRRALSAVALVWGFEIVLARAMSVPVLWRDICLSAAAWLCAAVVIAAVVHAARFLPGGAIVRVVLASSPLWIAGAGVLLPVAVAAGSGAVLAALLFLLLALVVVFRLGRGRGDDPFPSPRTGLSILTTLAAATWVFDPDPVPKWSVVTGAALLWVILAAQSRKPAWIAATAVAAVIVARWPLSLPSTAWEGAGPRLRDPDLYLLTVDTLRADAGAQMESYRRLARLGTSFPNAQAPAPWTLPSMATLLTGRPVARHGAGHLGSSEFSKVDEAVPTLAELLAERGYETAAVVAENTFLDGSFGTARGIERFQHGWAKVGHPLPRGVRAPGFARPILARAVFDLGRRLHIRSLSDGFPPFDAEAVVSHAQQVLDERRERPLFLWLHFMDGHLPYQHSPDLSRRLAEALVAVRAERPLGDEWLTEERRLAIWAAYTKEVAYVDRAIERFIGLVDATGREAVVVLASDHGEEFFEHGGLEHGHALYQEVVAIPLVIARLPARARAAAVVEEDVSLADVTATLLAAAGVPVEIDGRNLLAAVASRPSVTTNLLHGAPDSSFARREGRWKAIVSKYGGVQLFDLREDPAERRDLSAVYPERAARLAAPGAFWPPPGTVLQPAKLGERDRERLRALGYLRRDVP